MFMLLFSLFAIFMILTVIAGYLCRLFWRHGRDGTIVFVACIWGSITALLLAKALPILLHFKP